MRRKCEVRSNRSRIQLIGTSYFGAWYCKECGLQNYQSTTKNDVGSNGRKPIKPLFTIHIVVFSCLFLWRQSMGCVAILFDKFWIVRGHFKQHCNMYGCLVLSYFLGNSSIFKGLSYRVSIIFGFPILSS